MATPVEMPKLGNTVEECLVSRWVKRKGEAVSAGDLVAEIETDKATFEVTAPVDGTLLETFFEEGALVPVFTNLFVIGEAGESVESFRLGTGGPLPCSPKREDGRGSDGGLDGGSHSGSETLAGESACPTLFSPRARRFVEEHGFHQAAVVGSGPGGRVLEADLQKLYGAATPQAGMPVPPAPAPVPHIRERIARRMRESLATTAQYTLNASAEAGGLLALRAKIKAAASIPDVNINDLVAFCTIRALLLMPDLNAEFVDGKIFKHADVHLGFACDTPRGLLVPVIRNAHRMTAGGLALAAKDLTARAVQGTIAPDDLAGATFTISNLGGLGIESFTPLLNPPQVAILGVGAIQLKPIRKQGGVEFVDVIGLSLTCDHQVIDGAPGARFLKVLKEQIENVESLCPSPSS